MPAMHITLISENIGKAIKGKEEAADLLLTALLCSGHVLIEDVPGVGKTTLAKALAKSTGLNFNRVQFTPDLMPSDLTGIYYFNQKKGEFEFRKGPLFTNILLADEINRATPRTQSSLLECMEERQITVEGVTHVVENPFMVLATQNPIENQGTFPLPEAQLDRFFMRIRMGYPGRQYEQSILESMSEARPIDSLEAVISPTDLLSMQKEVNSVHTDKDILSYILDIIEATRSCKSIALGASPRGSIALHQGARAYAWLKGRSYVRPDDIIYLAPFILSHRIILQGQERHRGTNTENLIHEIVRGIKPPVEN